MNSDNALQKATVAIQGNKQPDISYQYGTNMPQLAQSPALVDLTSRVNEGDYNWADFFPGEQAVATVDDKVLGVPALVDNLAIVYNKDLFAAAGVPEPRRLDGDRHRPRRPPPTRPTGVQPWASDHGSRPRSGSTSRCCGRRAATS